MGLGACNSHYFIYIWGQGKLYTIYKENYLKRKPKNIDEEYWYIVSGHFLREEFIGGLIIFIKIQSICCFIQGKQRSLGCVFLSLRYLSFRGMFISRLVVSSHKDFNMLRAVRQSVGKLYLVFRTIRRLGLAMVRQLFFLIYMSFLRFKPCSQTLSKLSEMLIIRSLHNIKARQHPFAQQHPFSIFFSL